jgi:hypothetical protein
MLIHINIIAKNYTYHKQIKIDFDSTNIDDLLNYFVKKNILDSTNYIVYYNQNKIDKLPNLNEFSIIIKENKCYKECSCCKLTK